jgi:hypothetical protein
VLDSPFSARELVGLLADEHRRRVFAAMVLGATSSPDIRDASGLDTRTAARALQRLVDAGLVVRSDDGATHHVLGEAFALAARAEATRQRGPDEHGDEPDEIARVLRAFVREGRLVSIPASLGKRLVVLDWLVQHFEPGRRYDEAAVNRILEGVHPDTASLRRYLVDADLLARERGEYWRIGGSWVPNAGGTSPHS